MDPGPDPDPEHWLIVDHMVFVSLLDQLIVKQKTEALEAISGALGMPLTSGSGGSGSGSGTLLSTSTSVIENDS